MWDGELKKVARSIVFGDFVSSGKSIFLPGIECKCVMEALSRGVINTDSDLIFVERSKSVAEAIANKTGIFGNSKLFCGQIEDCKLSPHIDFAYLDFIGSMDNAIYAWIKDSLVPNLSDKFRIGLCFNYAWRPEVPFLKNKFADYRRQGVDLFDASKRYNCDGSYQIATYFLILKELFGTEFYFVNHNNKPYFKYQDNKNPMVLYTLESSLRRGVVEMQDKKFQELLEKFSSAMKHYDKRRGWKRMATVWSNNRSKETGTPPFRFINALKMRLTKLGHDASCV